MQVDEMRLMQEHYSMMQNQQMMGKLSGDVMCLQTNSSVK